MKKLNVLNRMCFDLNYEIVCIYICYLVVRLWEVNRVVIYLYVWFDSIRINIRFLYIFGIE